MKGLTLSLIYLGFNEAANLPITLADGIAFCQEAGYDWEIIVVNDGSSDETGAIAEEFAAQHVGRLRVVHHERNMGMGAGMRTGIGATNKDHLIFMPSDGQISPWEIPRLVELLPQADIVVTTYNSQRETIARELISRSFRVYMRLLAGIRFRLQGLYIFPSAKAKELLPKIQAESFFFSFEMIQRAVEDGLTFAHTTMSVKPRLSGESKVTGSRRIVKIAKEVWNYRIRRFREAK